MMRVAMLSLTLTLITSLAWAGNPEMGDQKVVRRGGDFTGVAKASIDQVVAKADEFSGKTVEVSGTVGTICKKKGCWLGLVGKTPAASARITFKNYAFFAPMDCEGAKVRVEGVVEVKKLSDGERAHLAEDEGKKKDEIPAVEVRITATALELTRS